MPYCWLWQLWRYDIVDVPVAVVAVAVVVLYCICGCGGRFCGGMISYGYVAVAVGLVAVPLSVLVCVLDFKAKSLLSVLLRWKALTFCTRAVFC